MLFAESSWEYVKIWCLDFLSILDDFTALNLHNRIIHCIINDLSGFIEV